MARLKYYNTKTNAWETVDSTFGTGNVKTVNGVEPDANGNIEIAVPGMPEINYPVTSVNGMTGDVVIEVGSEQNMVQSDLSQNDPTQPDYVKHRTHYEENNQTVIEWDGDTEGRDSLEIGGFMCYKVSDLLPTEDSFTGGEILGSYKGESVPVATENIIVGDGGFMVEEAVTVMQNVNATIAGISVEAPSTGVYFLWVGADNYVASLTYGSTVVHQLDEKWIPESIARKTDVTWENLPDKPFCDIQTVIEWDGSTEGREMLALTGDHEGAVCYKVHNNTPTQDELFGGVLGVDTGNGVEEVAITEDVFESTAGFNAVNCLFIGPLMIAYSTEISLLGETYTLQSTGIFAATYFRKLTYGSTKTIEPKFLPKLTAIADLTEAPTAEDFNALLAALRAAGYLATE